MATMASNESSHPPNVPARDPFIKGIDGPVMLTTILCLVFIAALLFVLHAYARYLLGHHRPAVARVLEDSSTTPAVHAAGDSGLDPSTIAALPTFLYGEGDTRDEGSGEGAAAKPECAVCLSPMEEGVRVRLLPKCNHVFHVGCIDVWLASHSTCPLCRRNADPAAAGDEVETAKAPPAPPPPAAAERDDASFVLVVENTSGSKEVGSTSQVEVSLHLETSRKGC